MNGLRDKRITQSLNDIMNTCNECGYTNRHYVHCGKFDGPKDVYDAIGLIELGIPKHLKGRIRPERATKLLRKAATITSGRNGHMVYPFCVPEDERP